MRHGTYYEINDSGSLENCKSKSSTSLDNSDLTLFEKLI